MSLGFLRNRARNLHSVYKSPLHFTILPKKLTLRWGKTSGKKGWQVEWASRGFNSRGRYKHTIVYRFAIKNNTLIDKFCPPTKNNHFWVWHLFPPTERSCVNGPGGARCIVHVTSASSSPMLRMVKGTEWAASGAKGCHRGDNIECKQVKFTEQTEKGFQNRK